MPVVCGLAVVHEDDQSRAALRGRHGWADGELPAGRDHLAARRLPRSLALQDIRGQVTFLGKRMLVKKEEECFGSCLQLTTLAARQDEVRRGHDGRRGPRHEEHVGASKCRERG